MVRLILSLFVIAVLFVATERASAQCGGYYSTYYAPPVAYYAPPPPVYVTGYRRPLLGGYRTYVYSPAYYAPPVYYWGY